MTRFSWILTVSCLLAFALNAARAPLTTVPAMSQSRGNTEAVYMLNGDIISGKFVEFNHENGLKWVAANIRPALHIDPAGIDRVTFEGQPQAKALQSRILLNSGSELAGQLEFADTDKVVINSWYAGRLEFKRTTIKAIIPASGSSGRITFSGPTASSGWIFSTANKAEGRIGILPVPRIVPGGVPKKKAANGKFQFNGNSLNSTGSGAMAGRKVEFPDKSITEFDLDWTGSSPRVSGYFTLNVNFFSNNLKSSKNSHSYGLRLSQTGANLSRHGMQDGEPVSDRLGQNARVNLTGIGSRARFSFRADRKKRTFVLLINGQKVANWKDKEKFAGKGEGLVFSTRSSSPLKISNIRISEWDGSLPASYETVPGVNKQDFVRLSNNDTITGSVVGIRENQIKIKTSFAEVNVPLTRISIVQFASKDAPVKEKLPKGTVTAKLKSHGSLNFKLNSWQGGKLEVESPDFGSATIDGSIIESITFNPNKKRANTGKDNLSKKELKKQLRNKEKGNNVPLPQLNK